LIPIRLGGVEPTDSEYQVARTIVAPVLRRASAENADTAA